MQVVNSGFWICSIMLLENIVVNFQAERNVDLSDWCWTRDCCWAARLQVCTFDVEYGVYIEESKEEDEELFEDDADDFSTIGSARTLAGFSHLMGIL